MTDRRALVGSLVPLLLLSAGGTTRCSVSTDSGTVELRLRGTVLFLETGVGCWRLDAGDGRYYELLPDQAPAALLQDGVRATVTGEPAEGSETGCRVGQPLAVHRVLALESPAGSGDS